MIYLTDKYFFVYSAVNFADISSTCNSPRFNLLSVVFLIWLLPSNTAKYHSVFLYWSLKLYFFLQRKISNALGQYLETLKIFSLRLHAASHSAWLEKFSCKSFPQQKCGAKLVTVTNQSVPRPPTTSFVFSQAKYFYRWLLIWLKTLNPKGYAAKCRYRKCLDVICLRNGNKPRRKKMKTFST